VVVRLRVVVTGAAAIAACVLVGCGIAEPSTSTASSSIIEASTATDSSHPAPPDGAETGWQVVRVSDGDTIVVARDGREEKVRLLGIDTPESVDPRRPVACFGREASARTTELADGQVVTLAADPTQDDRDRFGRRLAFVWLPDGRLLNLALVEDGYAHEIIYDGPTIYQDELAAAEADARTDERGLWAPDTCAGALDLPVGDTPSTTAPTTTPGSGATSGCSPEYEGACIPPAPPDLDCGDIDERGFASVGSDPHRLDGDGDGVACR
jgi:micrococcal nuclease